MISIKKLLLPLFLIQTISSENYILYENLYPIDIEVVEGDIWKEAFNRATFGQYTRTTLAKRGIYQAYKDYDLHHEKFPYLFSKIEANVEPIAALRCKERRVTQAFKYVDFIIYGKDEETSRSYDYIRLISLDKKQKNGVVYPLMANKNLPSDKGTSKITFYDGLSYVESAIYSHQGGSAVNPGYWQRMKDILIGQLNKYQIVIDAENLSVNWTNLPMVKMDKSKDPQIVPGFYQYLNVKYKKCEMLDPIDAHNDLINFETLLLEEDKKSSSKNEKKGKF